MRRPRPARQPRRRPEGCLLAQLACELAAQRERQLRRVCCGLDRRRRAGEQRAGQHHELRVARGDGAGGGGGIAGRCEQLALAYRAADADGASGAAAALGGAVGGDRSALEEATAENDVDGAARARERLAATELHPFGSVVEQPHERRDAREEECRAPREQRRVAPAQLTERAAGQQQHLCRPAVVGRDELEVGCVGRQHL